MCKHKGRLDHYCQRKDDSVGSVDFSYKFVGVTRVMCKIRDFGAFPLHETFTTSNDHFRPNCLCYVKYNLRCCICDSESAHFLFLCVQSDWRVQVCDCFTMSLHPSPHPRHHHPQQQLLSACHDPNFMELLRSLSNTSVHETANSGQLKNCVDLLTSFHVLQNPAKHLDNVSDLHVPDSGLAVYAFATPFILVIGNCFTLTR